MNTNGNKNRKSGFLLGFLFALCDRIASVFNSGYLFKVFTSHDRAEQGFRTSVTVYLFGKLHAMTKRITGRIKTAIARQFEESMILRIISIFLKGILNLPGRVCGSFILTWSAYAVLIEIIKINVLLQSDRGYTSLVCSAIAFISALPLMFTDKSVMSLAAESPIISSALIKIVGVPEEVLKSSRSSRSMQSTAVILGIVLGVMTYFVNPIYMLLGFASLILISLIMSYPESGVVLSITIAPLLGIVRMPSVILASLVLLTTLSYSVKVIRGKRVFKFGVTELTVYGFMVIVLAGGLAPGESNTMENAILTFSLMLIFPLIVNLMKYKHWIKTCMAALAFPAAISAFIGIAQYVLGISPGGWIDIDMFSDITARTVSLFENPNMLGAYLVALFPIILMFTLPRYNTRIRILGVISSLFVIVCTVLTFSRSAWIALAFGGLLFALLITPGGVFWAIPAAGATAIGMLVFPNTVGARVTNFFTLADSANSYRVSVWNSSWDMFLSVFTGGIGMGEEAFRTAYAQFANAGTNTVMHSHSLWMQIGIQLGLIGLIMFIASLFSVIRKSAACSVIASADIELTSAVKAALSGAAALLVAGIFDYTWYNFRIMFIFWALLGLACAASNINDCSETSELYSDNDEYSAFVSVSISGRASADAKKEKEEQDNE